MAKTVIDCSWPTNVEPIRRKVAGRFGWAVHRFPIKGGITMHEARARDATVELLRRWNAESILAGLINGSAETEGAQHG